MPNSDSDPLQNPYCSPPPTGEDGGKATCGARKRSRDLAQLGFFLGVSFGATVGAAITVSLDAVHTLVQVVMEPRTTSVSGNVDEWISHYVGVAGFGALLGAVSGAILGFVQGWLTAHKPPALRRRLEAGAAFCWAGVAAVWCLSIDQNMLSSGPRTWISYVAFLLAPSAAGCAGALLASRLARSVPTSGK